MKILTISIIVLSCLATIYCIYYRETTKNIGDSPFGVVVKLKNAESTLNYEASKEFLDIESVFKNSPFPEDQWKKNCQFFYSAGQDNKTKDANIFDYYNFNIYEIILKKDELVKIIFFHKKYKEAILEYTLKKKDSRWIVIDIQPLLEL